MIEPERTCGFGRLLLSGALSLLVFLTSCGKKAAETESVPAPSAAPQLPMNAPRELEEYKDPRGSFVGMLPKGYAFSDKTVGDKPKYIFTYGSAVTVVLTQGAVDPAWDSEAELVKKQDEIRTGRAGFPRGMVLVERGTLSFGGLKGFYTLLSGNLAGQETQMKAYFLAGEGKLFTLIVTWKDPAAGVLYGQVQSSITNSFRLTSVTKPVPVAPKPAVTNVPAPPPVTNVVARPAPVVAKPKPVEVVEPVDPRTDSEWSAARAMLKFTGSMKMGGQQVAMVNNKILRKGDEISVMFHDTEFTFIVTVISPNGVEYNRKPLQ